MINLNDRWNFFLQKFRGEHVFQRFRHLAIQKINYLRCFFHLRLTWARLYGVKTYFFPLKTKSWGQCWIDTTPKVAKYFWTEKIPWVRSKQFGSFFSLLCVSLWGSSCHSDWAWLRRKMSSPAVVDKTRQPKPRRRLLLEPSQSLLYLGY